MNKKAVHFLPLIFWPVLCVVGCGGGGSSAPASNVSTTTQQAAPQTQTPAESETPTPPEVVEAGLAFTDVTEAAGLDDLFVFGNSHTGGAAWIDYNNDYWPDLFISNGADFEHFLFRNQGDGTFVDVSHLVVKPDISLEEAGVIFADIDNDKDEDLVVMVDSEVFLDPMRPNPLEGGDNFIYINNGDGTFELGRNYGVARADGGRTSSGGFADYDRDGFVDLHLASWAPRSNPTTPDNPDLLLRNRGDGRFEDVTAATGVDGHNRDALVSFWFDANMDGWPDLYVGNVSDTGDDPGTVPIDALYINDTEGGFNEQGVELLHGANDTWAAMGADVGDIDNDGSWDLYITDVYPLAASAASIGNSLYKSDLDGQFTTTVAMEAGVGASSSWPTNFADLNLDGWVDLWVGSVEGPSWLYTNLKDGTFSAQRLDNLPNHAPHGGGMADYDGDGDLDLMVTGYVEDSTLMRNDTETDNAWLSFKLFGVKSNYSAIGALIKLEANGITQMRRVSGGDSSQSQSELIVHFGVETASQADITIEWPSGEVQNFSNIAVNQLLFIDEEDGVLDEQLVNVETVFNADERTFEIIVQSSFGGRTGFSVEGFGELEYDAANTRFSRVFENVSVNLETITIQSIRGNSWEVETSD